VEVLFDLPHERIALTRVCAAGDLGACSMLAYFSEDEQAALLYEKACDGGIAVACKALAQRASERDERVVSDTLYERACRLGDPRACYALARIYRERGRPEDLEKAHKFDVQGQIGDEVWDELGLRDKCPPP